jgi:hypothetical protein
MKVMLEAAGFQEANVAEEYEKKEKHFGRSLFYTVEGQRGARMMHQFYKTWSQKDFETALQGLQKSVKRLG